jgi:CHRD domain
MKNLGFRITLVTLFVLAAPIVASLGMRAQDDDGGRAHQFRAELRGGHEVPLTLSGAQGSLQLRVNEDDSSVHFVLNYEGLQTHILFSHIHVGQPNVNGGVTVFFCDNTTPPHTSRTCPEKAGMVEGDFTTADVIGLTSQQLPAHDLAGLLKAIRARQTYANLHTMDSPGGEIRGPILPGKE